MARSATRLVIDEEELRNAHVDLRDALPEAVDQPARADRSDVGLRLTIARVVGEAVTGKRRRIGEHVASGVIGETPGPTAADAGQAIAGGVDIIRPAKQVYPYASVRSSNPAVLNSRVIVILTISIRRLINIQTP